MKIYVPDVENYQCYVIQSEDVIRAYETIPTIDAEVSYRDYYINSNYIYRDGVQEFHQFSSLPVCLDQSVITNDVYYRNDLDSILIIFLIMCIFCFYIPIKIFLRLFRRFN